MAAGRLNISSGSKWEPVVGYSRAVRVGNQVFVSGTTAVDGNGSVVAPGDAYGQARFIFERIAKALGDAGASLDDVVRTRMYVTDIGQWEAIGRAHAEAFADAPPAATMVEVQRLIDPGLLLEVEVDAVVTG